MAEADNFDPALIGGLPTDPVVVDQRGTRMLDVDSYQRIIEGLKSAADAAQHLVARDPTWKKLRVVLDKVRSEIAKLGGMSTQAQDGVESTLKHGTLTMGPHQAYDRIYQGLRGAAASARQMATGHRGDLRWSAYAHQLEALRDKCSVLIRMKQQNGAGALLRLPH